MAAHVRLEWCERAAEYRQYAWEYLEAYNAVASQWPAESFEDQGLLEPKLFLLCHALELSMKGWLVLREGLPVRPSPTAPKQIGKQAPTTVKGYGHRLANIARAAGEHHKLLLKHLDTIEHLTISFWGSSSIPGSRDYEYPEGNWAVSYYAPSKLAALVKECNESLESAITQACRAIFEE